MSKKPGKERKQMANTDLHKKIKRIAAKPSKKLRETLGKKAISLRKGDIVKVAVGTHKGKQGKIEDIDTKKERVFVEKVIRKRSDGAEVKVPLNASNLELISIDKSDKKRLKKRKE